MSDIDSPPSSFWWQPNLDAATLKSDVKKNKGRLLSLKTFVDGGDRRYAAIWIVDGKEGDWNGDISKPDLKTKLGKKKRLVSVDTFLRNGEVRCAAAWIDDASTKWSWRADEDSATIKGLVDPKKQRPICLRRHVSKDKSHYSAIWIDNTDHRVWGWKFDATVDEINNAMNQNSRIVSIDTWNSDGTQRFAVIWNDNPGPAWFWNLGISGSKQDQQFDTFCCYGVDVVPWTSDASEVACVMFGYPAVVDTNEMNQLTVSGSAKVDGYDPNDPSRAGQIGTVEFKVKNLTSASLDISQVRIRSLSSGGYMLADAGFFDGGWPFAGQSTTLAANANSDQSASGVWTPMAANALEVRILTAQGAKHQRNSVNLPIAQMSGSAGPLVATTPDPVFVGLWANPVEIIPIWLDGKKQHWVTIAGHVVNSFPEVQKKLTIARLHLRLHDGNNVVIDEDLAQIFPMNPDDFSLATKDLSSAVTTTRQQSLFILGKKLSTSFSSGTLEVTLNYKLGDIETGQCGGFMQTWPAKLLSPHQATAPVKGKWNYGNAYNHTDWDGHASQFQRFSLDLTIMKNGQTNKPSTPTDPHPLNDNNSFWCFNQPFYAIEKGTVVSWDDTNPDNPGRNTSQPFVPWTGPPNYIVVESADGGGTAGYFHLKHGSIEANLKERLQRDGSATVEAGDPLAHVGNAGGTSEPHLHFGYLKKPDAHGRADMFPVEFTNLLDGKKKVDGTPSNQEFTS